MDTEQYFKKFEQEVKKVYNIADQARKKELDPFNEVEIPLAKSMAEKVVGLISSIYPQLKNSGITQRIIDLEEEFGKLNTVVAFKIAEEISKQKFCEFKSLLKAIDAGIRVGFAYITLGVVSSPIEGYTRLELGKRRDNGKEYFRVFFSGPIRSAGTTASVVVLMLIDYLRELFGYAKYDPSEDEIKRYWIENIDYHEKVTNLQYMPIEEEALFLARNLPIQIDGEPTEKKEVSNHKNLERVETNNIRGGMCLIFSEGLAQKAKKGMRLLKNIKEKGINSSGWDYLDEYIKLHEKRDIGKTDSSPTYINDLVAGRPVFSHPSRSGGFRFRYGRGRVNGFSASSVHPATMAVVDGFLAVGTQLKIEKPTKGTAITSCDFIEGPVVKLLNGSVKKLTNKKQAQELYPDIEEIIYLGDILFPFSDLVNRNADLIKPGYVEEWWHLELEEKNSETAKNTDYSNIDFEKAVELSKNNQIPLHPKYIFYWTQISKIQFFNLIKWIKNSKIIEDKIIFLFDEKSKENFSEGKRALELLGIEHEATPENIIINKIDSKALLINLGINFNFEGKNSSNLFNYIDENKFNFSDNQNILDVINKNSEFIIKDKAGEFIGARMGRPEKTKLRKLTGSPNALFPVGQQGGRLRSVQEACNVGRVFNAFPLYYCENCKQETIYGFCEKCNQKTRKKVYCPICKEVSYSKCKTHEKSLQYRYKNIDINYYLEKAKQKIIFNNYEMPELIKGVHGLVSSGKQLENLAKGILRAKYNLQVNKDGTIRVDATELPLISFRPKEISTSIEKLKELGYEKDIYGKNIENEEQIIELKPQDVVLPSNPEFKGEMADDIFIKVSKFVDDLLEKFYNLPRFYNVKTRNDLIGHAGVCMAPHNCAGIVCRFIGFSNTLGLLASPYLHAGIRRDCVFPTTNFVYSEEGQTKNENIGGYVENLIRKGAKKEVIDNYGTEKIESNKNTYAFGVDVKTKKLKKKKVKYFIRGQPPEKWVKVKTASGREQIMTPRHKFIYLDDKNNFQTKTAKEIKRGDRIGVLNKFNVDSSIKKIFLPEVFCSTMPKKKLNDIRIVNAGDFFRTLFQENKNAKKCLNLKERFNNIFDWYKLIPLGDIKILIDNGFLKWENLPNQAKLRTIFNNKEWDLNLKLSSELMWVLGIYSAEGYCRQNKEVSQVCFRIKDREQVKKLKRFVYNVFGLKVSLGEKQTKITICNKLVYYLFKYVLDIGKGAYDKKVPFILFNVPNKLVKEYLSAYFDGDGTIVNQSSKKFICFYSVSRNLLDGVSLLISKFGLSGRFYKTKERLPGKSVLERYKLLGKIPKKHVLHHLTYLGDDLYNLCQVLKPVNQLKKEKVESVKEIKTRKIRFNNQYLDLEKEGDILIDFISEVKYIKKKEHSYCFEVEWDSEEDKNVLWGEQIINARCDGDESSIMLLGDVLLNFSKAFLPEHRGGSQDAPLVLNAKINAGEVDDQILDLEFVKQKYPLELYKLAEQKKSSSKIKNIENVEKKLKQGKDPFINLGFTHNTSDFNDAVLVSTYKTIPTMSEKLQSQMQLVEKIRAADTSDTARLVIEKHFIRDMRGNLREFSMQNFRCVSCNETIRRPPLSGKCLKCGGKIIFTIHEGGIKKYLEPALELAKKYHLSKYLVQHLELTKRQIDSIFGIEPEKQEKLQQWF